MSFFFMPFFLLGFAQPDQINFEETRSRGALMEESKLVSTIDLCNGYSRKAIFLHCFNLRTSLFRSMIIPRKEF